MDNRSSINRWMDELPENKLELINSQLIINTMAGSRRIMQQILEDYGAGLVLAMASDDLWWAALREAYGTEVAHFQSVADWHAWADAYDYVPEQIVAGPQVVGRHRQIYEILKWALHYIGQANRLGDTMGRDIVTKLGEDGLTPDLFFIDRSCYPRMTMNYLDGPPTIAIEVVTNESAEQDKVLKLGLYEQAGVPEYWLIEPERLTATFYRLQSDGHYVPTIIGLKEVEQIVQDGIDRVYHSESVPNLSLSIRKLWTMKDHEIKEPWKPFLPIGQRADPLPKHSTKGGMGWDHLPFAPRADLQPVPIRFEEFASWCSEAKFERFGGGLQIGGFEGTRRAAGMLLMTLGLVDVVQMTHPRDWLAFLDRERYQAEVEYHTPLIMQHAEYRSIIPNEEYITGRIEGIDAISYSGGETEEEARQALQEEVAGWVRLRLGRGESIPDLSKDAED